MRLRQTENCGTEEQRSFVTICSALSAARLGVLAQHRVGLQTCRGKQLALVLACKVQSWALMLPTLE